MNTHPELIVMLTYNDVTVPQAAEVFAKCEHTRARYWGFKEAGLPFAEMRDLFARMKACGKQTCLEVVAYTEAECLRGAEMAAACGCVFLLGTVFSEAVNAYCRAHGLRYMPFVGQVTGRPSVLEGTAEEMVREAKRCLAQGAYGIDLLGYRYTGDAPALNRALTAAVGPVCIAGSVNSYARMNGILIRPGETFSFWHLVGKTTKRKGYRDGRILVRNHLLPGIGGGLCNLANTIHRVVLLSPLTVTEFHKHSDALAPDEGARVPFSSGTSVFYNNGDYRFKNETDQTFQLLLWCDADNLYAALRCEHPLPYTYRIVEEGHYFQQEGDKYYRVSKIYKETLDGDTVVAKELVLDNHSEVMYDYGLIPKEQIR